MLFFCEIVQSAISSADGTHHADASLLVWGPQPLGLACMGSAAPLGNDDIGRQVVYIVLT
jgi:hypothetical protein